MVISWLKQRKFDLDVNAEKKSFFCWRFLADDFHYWIDRYNLWHRYYVISTHHIIFSWQMDWQIDRWIDRWWVFPQLIHIYHPNVSKRYIYIIYIYSIPLQKLVTHISSEPRLGGMEQNQSASLRMILGGQIVSLRGSYPILEAARDKDWHMICLLLPGWMSSDGVQERSKHVLVAVKDLSLGPVDTIWYQPVETCWNPLDDGIVAFWRKLRQLRQLLLLLRTGRLIIFPVPFDSPILVQHHRGYTSERIPFNVTAEVSVRVWGSERAKQCCGMRNERSTGEWEFFVLLTAPRHLHLNLHLHLTRHLILHLHHHH